MKTNSKPEGKKDASWNFESAQEREAHPGRICYNSRRSQSRINWELQAQNEGFTIPEVDQAYVCSLLKAFFASRPGPGGVSLLSYLKLPVPSQEKDGWWVLEIQNSLRPPLASDSLVEGYHGFKAEGLYSILWHGNLFPSTGSNCRMLSHGDDSLPGVYIHSGATAHKAESYVRFISLTQDGVFVAFQMALMFDASRSVKRGRSTEQRIVHPDGCHIRALLMRCSPLAQLDSSVELQQQWIPSLEANPMVFGTESSARQPQRHNWWSAGTARGLQRQTPRGPPSSTAAAAQEPSRRPRQADRSWQGGGGSSSWSSW